MLTFATVALKGLAWYLAAVLEDPVLFDRIRIWFRPLKKILSGSGSGSRTRPKAINSS
jgi:hypothetical protein